ncbi:MAG: type III restriction endonuclease, partial [Anaerolineae bacterium]|nr:type III restriction endonuclease [Anaerolineae bacterium]
LDTPGSDKPFILLVNKGREGWNCRSLFGVALFRKPKSKIFVLQASMRCLRSIGDAQNTGHVYLSDENIQILDDERQQNFRVSIEDVQKSGQDREVIRVHVKTPVEKITLKRLRRLFQLREKQPASGFSLKLDEAPTNQYRLRHTVREGFAANSVRSSAEDISHRRQRRTFSALTLVAEVSRYLNRPCLEIEDLLSDTAEGIEKILERVNEFNELLYDCVIPNLFHELYDIREFEDAEKYEVDLVKIPEEGFYELSARSDLIVRETDPGAAAAKSFHLDAYCFDSTPERQLFWDLLRDGRVKKVYFTGMLTHGQSDFFVQYIDPESHAIRSYYPDFLVQKDDESYIMVEVKAEFQSDEPVVRAKQMFAEQAAGASGMTYRVIKGTDAGAGRFEGIFSSGEASSNLAIL